MARDAVLGAQALLQPRAGVRREDVKGRRLDALPHRPVDGPLEHRVVVLVHAEDEGGVDHDAEVVQAADGGFVSAAQVLRLAGASQVALAQRLEPDEQAAQPALDRLLQQAGAQHGLHGAGRLPQAAHAAQAVEERLGERRAAEEVVVKKVEVAARQAVDLGERLVHALQVERLAAAEEGLLVAEVADVGAAAADHERVGHQVALALDQVAARARHAG